MKHKVWFDEKTRILHITYVGMVDTQNHRELLARLNEIPSERKSLTLVDLSKMKMPRWDRKTRKALAGEIKQEEYPRVAVIGASPILRMLARTFTPLLDRKQAIKFFASQEEAVAWLKLL